MLPLFVSVVLTVLHLHMSMQEEMLMRCGT